MNERRAVDCSVIIVSWNVRHLLEGCLASLEKQRIVTSEIIVVDNGSSDGTVEMVQGRFPRVALIESKRNLGFARANNLAYKDAKGRHILFLNPDTELTEDTLQKTVHYLDTHSDVGVLGPKMLNPDGTLQRSVRRFPSLSSQLLILLKLHVFFPRLQTLRRYNAADFSYEQEKDVDQVMGAFFACPRGFLESVGTWDERFFLWFEEVDLCKRAYESGWKVRFVPSLTCTHHGGSSFAQYLSVEQQSFFVRSVVQYFFKHHAFPSVVLLVAVGALSIPLALVEHFVKPLLFRNVRSNA